MKYKLLAVGGVVTAIGIGGAAVLCQSAFNSDATQVVAMLAADLARQNGGKLPPAATINAEIAERIDASVIHGFVTDSSPTNVWGHPFEVEILPGGAVRCRSPRAVRRCGFVRAHGRSALNGPCGRSD